MPLTAHWIDSPRRDLTLYIGSVAVSWAILIAHVQLGVSALALYWIWILFLDGPHLWATWARTVLDREDRQRRRDILRRSLGWALLPVGTMALAWTTGERLPYFLFLAFVQVWAYWHVVRQHYGLLSIYQRKAGEPAGVASPIEYTVFYTVMLAPFVSFALRHPGARAELGLPAVLSVAESWIVATMGAITAAALVIWVGREARRLVLGQPVNVAKHLFLFACYSLHLVLLLHPTWSVRMDLLAFSPIITAFHNIQYQGVAWSYGQRRYGADPAAERFGLAARVHRNPLVWYLCGLGIAVALRYTTWSFDGRFWPFTPDDALLGGMFRPAELVNGWWWFIAMNHYYLDQHIWRISRDRSVQAGLGLSTT